MGFLDSIFGTTEERAVRAYRAQVEEANILEERFRALSDSELRELTEQFRARLREGETVDDVLPEAFAAVREAAGRAIGQKHFDVQLIGGMVLHEGKITEMKTGEGKTLVATLPLYLNALAGKGAHLVTPNDYLSRVGAGWMGPVYHALGIRVGVVAHEFSALYDPEYTDSQEHGDERLNHFRSVSRREAYEADITYGTNNEFGFDYLRDNLEYEPGALRQREHHFAIVDEVDSILIDEARTPLIISAPDTEPVETYHTFARIVPQLKEGADYNVDEKLKAVAITEEGIDKVEKLLGVKDIYGEKGFRFVRYLESALRARALFQKDKDYVVRDGQVIIVDEFTGRLMPGRRWSEGLHQAIEAKEGVQIQRESRTLATITFQNYFRMYEKLAGMTGTAQTSAEEFHKVYNLDVVTIPTHKPVVRKDFPDLIFRTERGKFQAVVREVKERHAKGQPVLIGTISIEKSERLSKMLQVEGVRHEVLNAKNHEREALIIAQAGRKAAVTGSTNMAGRGVDIILGGTPPDEKEAEEVCAAGGLHVIGTERHEARRIDNQLRGRSGRQGDPGSSQFFVSMEDDLMRIFGSDRIKNMMETLGLPEDQPIENTIVSKALEAAQAKIEGFHFDARKHILEYDDVLNKQRDAIYRMRREILFSTEKSHSEPAPLAGEESQGMSSTGSNNNGGSYSSSEVEKVPLKNRVLELIEQEIERLVEFHTQSDSVNEWNLAEIFETVKAIAGVGDEVRQKLREIAGGEGDAYEKSGMIRSCLIEEVKKKYEEREEALGSEAMRQIERTVLLRSIDMLWMEHLDQMEHLRDSVRLRAYGQRDPLVEYKREGSRLYQDLQAAIRAEVVNTIFKVGVAVRQETSDKRQEGRGKEDIQSVSMSPVTKEHVAGRNDPCPCGAAKADGKPVKYKHCHGKST